jgi:hypothetical protein
MWLHSSHVASSFMEREVKKGMESLPHIRVNHVG